MDIISIIATVLGWIPYLARNVMESFPMKGAPGLSFKTRLQRQTSVTLKFKLYIDISNERTGSVAFSSAYFIPTKGGHIRLDPAWKKDVGKDRHYCSFINAQANYHDRIDSFLRSREQTNTYIAIDPTHQEQDINEAMQKHAIGTFYVYLTWWSETNIPNTRLVAVKV